MSNPLDVLGSTSFVLLTTFRKDGTPVPTPVWVVRKDDELRIWTNPTAGKVKRIRRNPQVEIGPCTRGGRPLGRSVPATARILGAEETAGLRGLLIQKYGLVARLTALGDVVNSLLGRPPRPFGGLGVSVARGATGNEPAAGSV